MVAIAGVPWVILFFMRIHKMKDSLEQRVAEGSVQRKFTIQYPISLLFITSLFMLFLDFNFRGDSLIKHLSPFLIFSNAVMVFVFLFLVVLFISSLLFIMESLMGKVKFGKFKYPIGLLSSFVIYLLFSYINCTYLKFYLAHFVLPLDKSTKVAVGLFVVSIPLFLFVKGKFAYGKIDKWSLKVTRYAVLSFIVAFVLAFIIYVVNLIPFKGSPPSRNTSSLPHILLITCDSLNAPHMSLYGYKRKTTPNLEEFAKESWVFPHMHTNCNETFEAITCFLGYYPRPVSAKNILEHSLLLKLKRLGYKRRYFISFTRYYKAFHRNFTDLIVIRRFEKTPISHILYRGKNRQNFQWLAEILSEDERFTDLMANKNPTDYNYMSKPIYPLPLFFNKAISIMKESPTPVFIWMHLFEPHHPYIVPKPFDKYFGNSLADRYDSSIRYLDYEFGSFFKQLKKEGLYDRCVIIISSDHGESFGVKEGGWYGVLHGAHWLNPEVTRIPLIIRIPNQRGGKKPQTFAETVDIAPTIMEILKQKVPSWMEGESLVKYAKNEKLLSKKLKITVPASTFKRPYKNLRKKPKSWAVNNEDMYNAYWYRYKVGWFQLYAPNPKNPNLIDKPYRFLYYCVYDLTSDPNQRKNLIQNPKLNYLLKQVYSSPLVQFYWKREWKKSKGNV